MFTVMEKSITSPKLREGSEPLQALESQRLGETQLTSGRTHDDVFGELHEDGPAYRNVSQSLEDTVRSYF
jgi:hypothetical protein